MGVGCNTNPPQRFYCLGPKWHLPTSKDGRHHWKQNESASLRAATKAASSGRRPLDNPPRRREAWRQRGGAYGSWASQYSQQVGSGQRAAWRRISHQVQLSGRMQPGSRYTKARPMFAPSTVPIAPHPARSEEGQHYRQCYPPRGPVQHPRSARCALRPDSARWRKPVRRPRTLARYHRRISREPEPLSSRASPTTSDPSQTGRPSPGWPLHAAPFETHPTADDEYRNRVHGASPGRTISQRPTPKGTSVKPLVVSGLHSRVSGSKSAVIVCQLQRSGRNLVDARTPLGQARKAVTSQAVPRTQTPPGR